MPRNPGDITGDRTVNVCQNAALLSSRPQIKSAVYACVVCPKMISEFTANMECRSGKTLQSDRLFQVERKTHRHHLMETFGRSTISLGIDCIAMRDTRSHDYKMVKCDIYTYTTQSVQIKLSCAREIHYIIAHGVEIKFDIL